MIYVNEKDGTRTSWKPHDPFRAFEDSDWVQAWEYSDMVKSRLKADADMKSQIEEMKQQSQSSYGNSVSSNGESCLAQFIELPFLLAFKAIKFFFKMIVKSAKWTGSKSSSVTQRIVGAVFYIAIFGILIFFGIKVYNAKIKPTGYVTTKCTVLEYERKEREPSGKEIGSIRANEVLKIIKSSQTKNVTWLEVYKLEKNTPVQTWILLPDVVNLRKENKYLILNKNSKTWSNYYTFIDKQNKQILAECQNHLKESVKSIEVKRSTDNVLKESLKDTGFIFPKSGYLELYKASEKDFYYIVKENKTEFLKNIRIAEKEYKDRKLEYFPKH